ncbi:MAG TPA: acyltransferase family protein [Acidimicrobiales bacterium]|nr:acyltransferase family protein [Acidimicrobiales bacterium]
MTRLLPSGDEAGTAPEDRVFRPDVEGLRAVAVLLVVLYHAGVSQLTGGYVGVDVFFVISGFVITGVLLRERVAAGTTSLLGFYARRCRRILPAATLVLICTVVAAHVVLGWAAGARAADDAKWAAVFMANFHFASVGTNYLAAELPPSPLQNFWTLSVEEQFYLVFPTLFLLVAGLRLRIGLRTRLLAVLGALCVCSLTWSIVQTASNPNYAYFSPFTRAWELGLGAMVALAAPKLTRIPGAVAAPVTWIGLAAIAFAGVAFNSNTSYPGILVAIPVVGAAMVIAGGTANPLFGAERLLGIGPMRKLGRISYSLYLWHWPILILAAESQGQSSLPLSSNLAWLLVALLASIVTYWLVENPVRHSAWLRRRGLASVGLGAGLIAVTLLVATVESTVGAPAIPAVGTTLHSSNADLSTVEKLVHEATAIRSVPAGLQPPLQVVDTGFPPTACGPIGYGQTNLKPCLFGDPHGTKTMVLYGDSHSAMWFQTIDAIAAAAHWKLWYLGKSACPVELLPMMNPGVFGTAGGEFQQCDQWHSYAIAEINRLRPDLVIVTQETHPAPGDRAYSNGQWSAGLTDFFSSITVPNVQFDVIGNIPQPAFDPPQCLDVHPDDVPACSSPKAKALTPYAGAEADAVRSVGGRYVDVTPWFCSVTCTAVIGNYQVYFNSQHVMGNYATFLQGVMADALQLAPGSDTAFPLSTQVLLPTNGAVLRGTELLVAAAPTNDGVHIQFVLTGHGYHKTVVATAHPTYDGWAASWNTAGVPNGTYLLESEARRSGSATSVSRAVVVRVMN